MQEGRGPGVFMSSSHLFSVPLDKERHYDSLIVEAAGAQGPGCQHSLGGRLKIQVAGPHNRSSDLVGLGWSQGVGI